MEDQQHQATRERLASLEAKMEMLLELLKEIREDLKNNPSREEINALEERVRSLEENQSKSIVKIATIAGSIAVITSIAGEVISWLLMK